MRKTKLSDNDIRWIRNVGYPRATMKWIAKRFKVSTQHICDVVNRKRRAEVRDKACPACGR